jgi:hypothetical protein
MKHSNILIVPLLIVVLFVQSCASFTLEKAKDYAPIVRSSAALVTTDLLAKAKTPKEREDRVRRVWAFTEVLQMLALGDMPTPADIRGLLEGVFNKENEDYIQYTVALNGLYQSAYQKIGEEQVEILYTIIEALIVGVREAAVPAE